MRAGNLEGGIPHQRTETEDVEVFRLGMATKVVPPVLLPLVFRRGREEALIDRFLHGRRDPVIHEGFAGDFETLAHGSRG